MCFYVRERLARFCRVKLLVVYNTRSEDNMVESFQNTMQTWRGCEAYTNRLFGGTSVPFDNAAADVF